MIDRVAFYNMARANPFGGSLTQGQVDGTNVILDAWDGQSEMTDPRWLAYMLATTKHETGSTMQPIEEWGYGKAYEYGRPDPQTGQRYYGRGFVQLTWKANYARMGLITGYDLVKAPSLALEPTIAVRILFEGMKRGVFTGKKLADYFNDTTDQPITARRIVNGMDRAEEIAGIHRDFLKALSTAKETA